VFLGYYAGIHLESSAFLVWVAGGMGHSPEHGEASAEQLLDGLDIAAAVAGSGPNLLAEFGFFVDRAPAGAEIHGLGWRNLWACWSLTDLVVQPCLDPGVEMLKDPVAGRTLDQTVNSLRDVYCYTALSDLEEIQYCFLVID
jgi:hypothetical protein